MSSRRLTLYRLSAGTDARGSQGNDYICVLLQDVQVLNDALWTNEHPGTENDG